MSISFKVSLAIFTLLATSIGGLGIHLPQTSSESRKKSTGEEVSSQPETTDENKGDQRNHGTEGRHRDRESRRGGRNAKRK